MTVKSARQQLYETIGGQYPQDQSVLEYVVRNVSPEETLRIVAAHSTQTDTAFRQFSETYGKPHFMTTLLHSMSPEVLYSFNARLVIVEAYLLNAPTYMSLPISPDPKQYILDTMIELYHKISPQREMLVREVYRRILGDPAKDSSMGAEPRDIPTPAAVINPQGLD